jgi:hypothetical protein
VLVNRLFRLRRRRDDPRERRRRDAVDVICDCYTKRSNVLCIAVYWTVYGQTVRVIGRNSHQR